jgi:hypothetical protein
MKVTILKAGLRSVGIPQPDAGGIHALTREAFDRATQQIPALAHYDHKKHKIRNG